MTVSQPSERLANLNVRLSRLCQRLTCFSVLLFSFVTSAQPFSDPLPTWQEGASGKSGANREYRDRLALIPWHRPMGDWCDKAETLHGSRPFSTTYVAARQKQVSIDISHLVERTVSNNLAFVEVMLKTDAGKLRVHSRQTANTELRPYVRFETHAGPSRMAIVADSYLDKGTNASLGLKPLMATGPDGLIMLRAPLPKNTQIQRAELVLSVKKVASSGVSLLAFGQCLPTSSPGVEYGIAANYNYDEGIEGHPSVVLADDFDDLLWLGGPWTHGQSKGQLDIVETDPKRQFAPFNQKALRVGIAKGKQLGSNLQYIFRKDEQPEPEALYLRYYIRFADDWQTIDGGKLPGLSGTYNRGGWGGRKANGKNGWSSRGLYKNLLGEHHPMPNHVPIGSYLYHKGQESRYGDNIVWAQHGLGIVEKNRWYSIEQFVKLNTPGRSDGELKAWIDGRQAYHATSLVFRDTADLKIETIWMNVYHGGGKPSAHNIHLYVDNVVAAKQYIGPVKKASNHH